MTTTKPRYIKMAYLLDAAKLRQLVELLKEHVTGHIDVSESLLVPDKELDYSVKFSDETSRTFSSVEDVLSIPNSSKRTITSLNISTPLFYSPIRASVHFRQERILAASYDLAGEDKEVLALADKLDEYMLGVRQWYSPLTRFSLVWLIVLLPFVILVLVLVVAAVDYFFPSSLPIRGTSSSESISGEILVSYGGTMLIVAGVWFIGWLLKRVFPVSTFAIGQGIDRHERIGKIRAIVLTGVFLTVPAGLLVNYLS